MSRHKRALALVPIVHVCPDCWQRCISFPAYRQHWGLKHKSGDRERPAEMLFWQVPKGRPLE